MMISETPDVVVVDARFAGGPLNVEATPLPYDPSTRLVRLAGPCFDVELFAHEAIALAAALQRAAASTAKLRRRVDAVDHLRDLEG